jgi:hypothetical protein
VDLHFSIEPYIGIIDPFQAANPLGDREMGNGPGRISWPNHARTSHVQDPVAVQILRYIQMAIAVQVFPRIQLSVPVRILVYVQVPVAIQILFRKDPHPVCVRRNAQDNSPTLRQG